MYKLIADFTKLLFIQEMQQTWMQHNLGTILLCDIFMFINTMLTAIREILSMYSLLFTVKWTILYINNQKREKINKTTEFFILFSIKNCTKYNVYSMAK